MFFYNVRFFFPILLFILFGYILYLFYVINRRLDRVTLEISKNKNDILNAETQIKRMIFSESMRL